MDLKQWIAQIRAVLGIIQKERAFGGPVQINLNLTNHCNLRCVHCYYYSPYLDRPNYPILRRARQLGDELPDKDYLKRLQTIHADAKKISFLIDELLCTGVRRWQIGGSGEPFMHKDVLEFISRIKQTRSYCFANTNGTLLDAAKVDELVKVGFNELRITTLAGTPEVYVRTHPGTSKETFERLTNMLLYFAEQKAVLGVHYPEITLVFIVIAQNVEDVFKFAEFAARVKADRVVYRPVDDVDDPGLINVVPTEKQTGSIRKQIGEAESYLNAEGIPHNIGLFRKIFLEQLNTEALYRVIPCYYGWLAAFIEPDGGVYPCCRCYNLLGNVNETKFSEIWNGSSYRRFRKDAMKINVRGAPVDGCDCYSCVHHTANLRVYRALHPIKGKSARLKQLSPDTVYI
jgi:radical SAM protein with 4Fe4S-binding SPASM domain